MIIKRDVKREIVRIMVRSIREIKISIKIERTHIVGQMIMGDRNYKLSLLWGEYQCVKFNSLVFNG